MHSIHKTADFSKIPGIDTVSQDITDKLMDSIKKLSSSTVSGNTVPLDLSYGNNYFEQMERIIAKTISQVTDGYVGRMEAGEIEAWMNLLNTPSILFQLGESIMKNSKELLSFDFGRNLNNNYGMIVVTTIIPLFINSLKDRIESMREKEKAEKSVTGIKGTILHIIENKKRA